jgi:hypothetical protein
MPVDTRGLLQEHVGKRLRIALEDGKTLEVNLMELTVCEEPEPCCGITYRLLSAKPSDAAKEQGEIYWTGFHEIEDFQVLGEQVHGTV